MKVKQVYVCEKCGRTFSKDEEAIACEYHHLWPVSMALPENYKLPIDEMQNGCPRSLVITMSDNKKYSYIYAREGIYD